jgi:hypothetical protein
MWDEIRESDAHSLIQYPAQRSLLVLQCEIVTSNGMPITSCRCAMKFMASISHSRSAHWTWTVRTSRFVRANGFDATSRLVEPQNQMHTGATHYKPPMYGRRLSTR